MSAGGELREFLVSRRAAIAPEDVGLPRAMSTRRVPGLRREEVAILAGVSVDYYVKLEQGRAANVSNQVLEAIERALRLDDLERRHLRTLLRADATAHAAAPVVEPGGPARPVARASVVSMVDALAVPAIIHGPLLDVLGLNPLATALFDDFAAMPLRERNLVRWMFLNPRAREVYIDWEPHAAQMVAILRADTRGPHAARLDSLVSELRAGSPDFDRHWAHYQLYEHSHGVKRFFNDTVGDLRLNYQSMLLPADPGTAVIVYSADPGSPSAEKLGLLASWIGADVR
jgi:transcriptional regulator with XRE-family HTH domain